MWWRWLCAAVLWTPLAAAADFPYDAYVNTDDVYVRSGPGRDYYPTAKLRKGARVEIYRQDPGGWLAIRPPRDSFAWVNKRHLDPDGSGLATVNSDQVVARVGSAFSEVRDVIQVRLERGETVEIVGETPDDSPWYKIAPPAGEFRWVFSKYVDRQLPADLAEDQREADGARGYVSNRDDHAKGDVRLASASGDVAEAAGATGTAPLDHDSRMGRELSQIDLQLSTVVAKEIGEWSFDDFRQRADAALRAAETPVERGHARLLLAKLERFEDIKRRHEALRNPSAAAPAAAVAGPTADAARLGSTRFDGIGRLAPVISEKVGGPQYALVDNSNAVVSFVTAAPGVNLRLYVDHYVGVNGQRGYMTDLERQHIMVQRVTVLDTVQR